jgi:hypothetical protein
LIGIQNLKVHYRKHIIVKHLAAIEKKTEVKISILDAIRFLRLAWDNVSMGTINHCFRHAGFVKVTESTDPDYESDPDDDVPLSYLVTNGVTLVEYARADESLITCAPMSDDSIVEEVLAARNTAVSDFDPDSDTENEEASDLPLPSLTSATEALELLTRFVESRNVDGNPIRAIGDLTNFLTSVAFMPCPSARQTLLTDFVNVN